MSSTIAANRLANLEHQIAQASMADNDLQRNMTATTPSLWGHVKMTPPDPILGLNDAFKADTHPKKLNLGVGAYRDAQGKPVVLQAVRKAEMKLVSDPNEDKEYLPITGIAAFCKAAQKLAFGECAAVSEGRIATAQALSGTGSLRVGCHFLSDHYSSNTIYVCKPTWGNHNKIFPAGGLSVKQYRYYDPKTIGLDFAGMLEDLSNAEPGAIVLLHSCAHNPTGVDPSPEQWQAILDVCLSRKLFAFFDSAYQGFASGDLDRDAYSLRLFLNAGVPMLLAQSFAKNMGLYGERAGAIHVVCASAEEASRVSSQLKAVIRPMYSSPPRHGAAIAAVILNDPVLYQEWCVELKMMADRINDMRKELYSSLVSLGTPGTWTHITSQIGMFSYTGLTPAQVDNVMKKWHIYLTQDGRISMAGLNAEKCKYLAEAIYDSVKSC